MYQAAKLTEEAHRHQGTFFWVQVEKPFIRSEYFRVDSPCYLTNILLPSQDRTEGKTYYVARQNQVELFPVFRESVNAFAAIKAARILSLDDLIKATEELLGEIIK